MTDTKTIAAPQQKRSQATLERLLDATVRALDEHGLDGAVIPRIAALAEVAPASIYRRFANKDALIRAALLHVLQQSQTTNRAALADALHGPTLAASADALMGLMFRQHRQHPGLVRALARFIDADTDQDFVATARAIMSGNLELLVQCLLVHSAQIRHPAPERALRFAVLQAITSIEAVVLEPTSLWHSVLPMSADVSWKLRGLAIPRLCRLGVKPTPCPFSTRRRCRA